MSSTTFDCVACMETLTTQPIAVLNHRMCLNCCQAGIVSQFHAALRDPTSYPVKYASQELEIDNFAHFFDAQFLRDWAAKKDEYDTPIANRIYCAGRICGRYLGLRSDHRFTTHCPSCGGRTCADCSSIWLNNRHVCEQDESEPLQGQQRGLDYQVCPGCLVKVHLQDGCNHMTCEASGSCRTQFCYICGHFAHRDSGHWSVGMPCPRYGQPGDERAIYDNANANPFDFDAEIRAQLSLGMDIAAVEQAPPPDAPPELRARYADGQTLHRIANQAINTMNEGVGDEGDMAALIALFAPALLSAIEAYTLHLSPGLDSRLTDLAMVERIHPFVQQWHEIAVFGALVRFPEIEPIYERYLRARAERLRELGVGDGH